jgi:penicillin-binding protein 1C
LLFRIFNTIDYDSDEEWFTQPAECVTRLVCSQTGLPPSSFCNNIINDYFLPVISTSKTCDHMREVIVSPDEKISYCKSCMPAKDYKKKLYNNFAPDLISYFEERNIGYTKIPSHNPDCEKVFAEHGPAIMFPKNGSEYLLSRKNPEPIQLKCRAAADVSKVYWYINNKFYKSAEAHANPYFVPVEGPVKISCTDDKGRNRDINITVRYVDL